jgi:hypothetical protein
MPATALQALPPEHSSARSFVEIVETIEPKSTRTEIPITAQKAEDISFLAPIPDTSRQGYSQEKTKIPVPDDHWSAALEQRFARLAALVAAETASVDQKNEFAKLQSLRRRTYLARSGAEVLRDFELRQRTADLILALRKYVEPLATN